MQTFDTIKLQLPAECVNRVEWAAFNHTTVENGKTGEKQAMSKARHDSLPIGVISLGYKEGQDFQLIISAKTLKDNYLQGINLNTFEQALKAVEPVMQINPYKLIESDSKVYLCDTTNNVQRKQLADASQYDVCQALLAGRANDRFAPKWYESTKKLGVEFHGTQQEKNRLICYSKNLDLLKPQNKGFMNSISNPAKMLHDAEQVIRFEVNHTSFAAMKGRFVVTDNTLKQLLNSKEPVNRNFLAKVLNIKGNNQMGLFDEWQTFEGAGTDFIYLKGVETIIKELGYNDVQVKQFFKQCLGGSFKYHYFKKKKSIKEIMAKMKAQQTGKPQKQVGKLCNMCLDALQVAVL